MRLAVIDMMNLLRFGTSLVLACGLLSTAHAGGQHETYDDYLETLYRDTVPLIEPERLSGLLGDDDNAVVLLDIRTPAERSVSHIAGSRFIRYAEFSMEDVAGIRRDATVVLYCAVGFRSERVGEQLRAAGFTDVFNLYGGIIAWHNRGLPVTRGGNVETSGVRTASVVHGYDPRWGRWVRDGAVTYEPRPEE